MVLMSRRGVFFTIASMFFVAALFLIFSTNKPVAPYDTKTSQVLVLDDFRDKIESLYVPLLTRQSLYQAFYQDSQAGMTIGYLSLPYDVNETVWHGTLRGVPVSGYVSLPQQFVQLETISQQLGYNLSIRLVDVSFAQSGPYQISYTVNVTFNLTSIDYTTSFQRNASAVGAVSLVGVPDLYFNRNAAAMPIADRHFFKPYAATQGWNSSAVLAMSQQGAYRATNQSPGIYERLQGLTTPNKWGVESFMPTTVAIALANMTTLDHQYFPPVLSSCTYESPGAYANLRLTYQGLFDYNITDGVLDYDGGACPPAP